MLDKLEGQLRDWQMYDIPVTISVLAPTMSAAEAYTKGVVEDLNDQVLQAPHLSGSSAYSRDHTFIDGQTKICDCPGH